MRWENCESSVVAAEEGCPDRPFYYNMLQPGTSVSSIALCTREKMRGAEEKGSMEMLEGQDRLRLRPVEVAVVVIARTP